MAIPSVLSPETSTPDSPQASIVHPALPLPRVSGSNEILCIGPSRGFLHLQQSLPRRQKSWYFSQLDVIWVLFWHWCFRLGSPAWGLDPTFLRGNLLATKISLWNFSCHPWDPSQSYCAFSTLPACYVVVKRLLLSVCGYKASLQLVLVSHSG